MWPKLGAKTLKQKNYIKWKNLGLSTYLNHSHPSVLCSRDETWRRVVLSRSAFRHILSIGFSKEARFEQCDRNSIYE
jgi:hypothetical protein